MHEQVPTLDSGVTFLDDGDAPAALYHVVGRRLAEAGGPAYWLDARNAAAPGAIRPHAPERADRSLEIARAFTGYQHYELVRSLPQVVSPETTLVVVPNLVSLYAEDDVPEYEADEMLDATLQIVSALADAVDAPVVLTASTHRDRVRAVADRTLEAERTRAGLRIEGESFRTDLYWDDWGFQTTIPYWVDLLGAVDEGVAVERGSTPVDLAAWGV